MWNTSVLAQQRGPCSVRFSFAGDNVIVSFANTTDAKFLYYVSPTETGSIPALVWLKIKDENNQIVSATPTNPDGFWTFRLLESNISRMPLIPKCIDGGERVEMKVAIKRLMMGLESGGQNHTGRRYLFKVRVYIDENAEKFLEFESDWVHLGLSGALETAPATDNN
jgi:hypothetical protein